jgi:hypothetical protein
LAKGPVFLERRTYRLRRMMDAVKLLPLLGFALWMVPLIWPLPDPADQTSADPMPMSMALLYLFGVWVFLVFMGWLLWRRTAGKMGASGTASSLSSGPEEQG